MTNTPCPETLVNTTTSGSQTVAATLALDDGGWVVVWSSDGQDGDGNGLYQQALNADGTARGDETRINTYTTDDQYFRSVTALADGGWLVTMESVGQDGNDRGICQQRFDANSGSIDEGDRVVLSFLEDITSWKVLVRNHIEDHGRDLWITSETGTTIVLKKIAADDLGRGDFLF